METEKFELMLDEAQANAALEKGMLYADTFVNKNYLINLDRYPLVELDSAEKSDEYIRLYQIERIVYDVDENANDKLISVYSAFFNIQAAGLLVIKSTRNALGFYIGVRSVDNTSTAEAILEKSFKGNFAGSQIQAIPQEEVQKVLGSINKSGRFGTRQNVSSVSIVPSTRDEDKERFVQGIEKFIDTMKGSEYTAVFIAEPLDKEILEQRKRGLQKIYSGLSPFASTQLSYGENYSKAVSKGMSENFSKTLNDSLTDTTSHFNSRSTSRSHGTSFGFLGIGFNNSTSTGYSSGSSWASAVTRGTSETKGETVTETDTDTTGDSRTITVTSENKSVKYILEKIDQHLARIKNCEAFGLWDIACYFVSENVQTSVVAASTYKALMAGFDSGVENSYVNVWKQDNTENTPALLEYLRYCIHPRFSIPGDDQFFEVESQTVNPCSLISGNEMPYIMGLPHHSVPGVTVLNMAEFGRNVRFSSGAPRGKKVELGQVYHMGEKETARVKLNLESFRSHCFITGSTGSGKSNTTYRILDEMIEHKIPFLVVEPAKGEYKRYYGKLPGIHVYCTNPRYYSMLHINPFRFNQGIHVLEHLVGKVTNLKAIGGDEMVTLSWTKAPTVTEIRLYKYCGYERPQDDSQYETIPCTRLDGLLVSGLTNGTNYWFAISAGHTLNGKTYFSEKAYLSAVPQKPAKPLQDFSVQLIDEVFQAKWTQSEWDVILFYAKQKPEYAVGTIYDLNELLSKYEKIDINLKSLTEAEFRLNFVGECYIVPGVINASNVILNVASYISSVPGAKDVSFDINSAATEMYVNFTWPKKIDRSLLVYRMDSYPTGIDDPLAHKIECSKRQYEANEGILISNPAKGTFYAEVYTYFESDRHRVYSDACRALLSNEPQKDVFYTLKYKKSGLFSKKCTLTVEIETEGACVFPAFAIVSKFKSTPLKRGDGDIVCTVNENTEIKGSHTFEFDVSPMKADTRLKMFFLNDKNYKSFKIACKAGNNI